MRHEQCVRQGAVRQMSRAVDGRARVAAAANARVFAQSDGETRVARDEIHDSDGRDVGVARRTTRR